MRRKTAALCVCATAAIDCAKVPDHYATLNVTKNATREQIRGAARAAQLRTHPDKERAGDAFHKVQLAAATLLKSSKKNAYDRFRAHCEKPWLVRWVELRARKWSRWSSNAVPIYIYIFYIGDPTALWAFIATAWASFAASCLQAWAWIVANPGTTAVAVAVAVAIVAVGAKWFFL